MTRPFGRRRDGRRAVIGLIAGTALAAAGCRAALGAATPADGGTAAPIAPPIAPPIATPLSLDAYRDRVATAAAVWPAARATGPAEATRQARAQMTASALVGRPVAVRLRSEANARSNPTATGPGRVMTADALVTTDGSASSRGSDSASGPAAASGPDAALRSDGSSERTGTARPSDRTPAATPLPATAAAAVAARLSVVRDEIAASRGDDTAAREKALERVLAAHDFDDGRSPWQQALAWVTDRIKRWWDGASLPAGTGEAALRIGQVVGWVAALIVLTLTGVWIARTLAGLADGARVADGPHAAPTTPAEARARAEVHAAAGDYRAAVRQLYLAALLVLEANGLLRADRSRTNHEQLAALAGNAALRGHMAAVVDTFDRVWYGVTVPDAATFRAYADAIHHLEGLALAGPPFPPSPPSNSRGAS